MNFPRKSGDTLLLLLVDGAVLIVDLQASTILLGYLMMYCDKIIIIIWNLAFCMHVAHVVGLDSCVS